MAIIGLTGGFGTGKTFVASVLKRSGARVIDADLIAQRTIMKGRPAYKKVVAAFGSGILDSARNIDRKALARIVFNDRRKLKKLNGIIHPEVIKIIKREIRESGKGRKVVIDAPLLVEAKLTGLVDRLIVVTASRARQVQRCRKKFRMNEEEVCKRIRCQMPLSKKVKLADFVIDNNGSRTRTERQIKAIWRNVWK
jgi:dephospho-CoA kinase